MLYIESTVGLYIINQQYMYTSNTVDTVDLDLNVLQGKMRKVYIDCNFRCGARTRFYRMTIYYSG